MTYEDTIANIKANYSAKHLSGYDSKGRNHIRYATAVITTRAFVGAIYRYLKGGNPPIAPFGKTIYADLIEKNRYKAWFSKLWVKELVRFESKTEDK